ncbi:MAG: lysophospholipid acyltransferase family protein [Alphaproteobacteria bacterium]
MNKGWYRIDKKIAKSAAMRRFISFLVSLYVRLVWLTSRFEIIGADEPRARWESDEPFILSFWHGRLLMMPYCWDRSKKVGMLISNHRDGELIANTIGHFGLGTIRGSSAKAGKQSKGGTEALREMLKTLKQGNYVGITPDGPRGPRMRASDGIVAVARMSGVPVIPATSATKARIRLGSWDRFLVPLPFTKGVIMWGDPILIPKDKGPEAAEAARLKIEQAMNDLADRADKYVGQECVAPAPMPQNEAAG